MSVTAVLLNWKRPWNIPLIVERLQAVPEISEIIIWDNGNSVRATDYQNGTLRTFRYRVPLGDRTINTYTRGRFLAAIEATTDWIYTQDDDVLVNNIPEILACRETHPNHITAALTDGHYNHEAGKAEWQNLGWGSCFRRDWIEPAFKPWLDAYGENELLHRKADRIFTMMIGKDRHNPIHADVVRLKDPNGKFSDCSEDALWHQPDHFRLTQQAAEAVRRLKAPNA